MSKSEVDYHPKNKEGALSAIQAGISLMFSRNTPPEDPKFIKRVLKLAEHESDHTSPNTNATIRRIHFKGKRGSIAGEVTMRGKPLDLIINLEQPGYKHMSKTDWQSHGLCMDDLADEDSLYG